MSAIRLSKYELLRIIAISMIVLHHSIVYGVMDGGQNFSLWETGSWFNRVIACVMDAGGEIGVGLFFMLTGFFAKKDMQPLRKILSIVAQSYYYAFLSLIFCLLVFYLGYRFDEIGFTAFLRGLVRITLIPSTGGCWWFVTAYVFLVLLSPKINEFFERYRMRGKFVIVAFIWFFWYVAGSFGAPFYIFYRALFFYLIGICLRDYFLENKELSNCTKMMLFLGFLTSYSAFAALDYFLCDFSLRGLGLVAQVIEKLQTALCVPLACICFFAFVSSLKDFSNSFINRMASFSFAVYLMHDPSILHFYIWKNAFKIPSAYNEAYFPLYAVGCLVLLFILAAFLDSIRQSIQPRLLNSCLDKIDKFNRNNYKV